MAPMRIGGLASGMDIDQLVSDLMKAERMPLDKLKQKKQLLEWQRDDYREMNKLLRELDTFIFDGIYRQSTFIKQTVTTSKPEEVSIKNISSTSPLNSTINVTKLAKAASMNSSADIRKAGATFDPNGKLADQRANLATDFTSNTFTIQAIKSDGTLGTAVSFTIDPNADSLNSILQRINSSNAGVTAFYDSQSGKVSFMAKNTGNAKDSNGNDVAEIIVTGDFLTGSLKLDGDNITAASNGRGQLGENAQFTLNGLSMERTSNVFEINGYEYTLKFASSTDISISATTDVDSIYNSIKAFVDKYNEIIDKINSELKEERYRDYPPLTDEQKEAMTDKQIELWEEKARSGMLRNDSILSNGLSKMRMDLYTKVESSNITSGFSQLAEIGITTSPNYLNGGKLIIDETKLRQKIQENPDAIYRLFNNDSTNYSEKGIANRLRDTIKDTIGKIEQKAGNTLWTNQQFSLGRSLDQIEDQIDRFEDRLVEIEDRYWRQFTAMERAINQYNSQSMYLMNAFGGGM
ncbi:MAG TPA: flagellar hook-associated protein 2 [Anoxybacillus sp.]|jgi:flagellar hook-associated protein 2|nr:flagellar hook-associated protein 2 [Anoxybacillus sp.]